MKLPEKLKKGLKVCRKQYDGMHWISCHLECPYKADGVWCEGVLHKDALAYIQQLESSLAQFESERDAAVGDLQKISFCEDCKHLGKSKKRNPCRECQENYKEKPNWEWRGVCPENTKEK